MNCQQRRQAVDAARADKVARIQKDVRSIVRREIDYTRKIIELVVPISITWNEDAWNRVKDFVPVRVEVKDVTPKTNDDDDDEELQ
jgi:hypothetical protein